MANRCAFLLGVNQKERDSIIEDFNAIYNLRSEIVHGVVKKLSKPDNDLWIKAQVFLAMVVSKEFFSHKEWAIKTRSIPIFKKERQSIFLDQDQV